MNEMIKPWGPTANLGGAVDDFVLSFPVDGCLNMGADFSDLYGRLARLGLVTGSPLTCNLEGSTGP
jgi:hypothetical protein